MLEKHYIVILKQYSHVNNVYIQFLRCHGYKHFITVEYCWVMTFDLYIYPFKEWIKFIFFL